MRAEYKDRTGSPIKYTAEYARAWGVMAEVFDGNVETLFLAVNSSSYIAIVDSMHLPYLKHALEVGDRYVPSKHFLVTFFRQIFPHFIAEVSLIFAQFR